jgi:3-hydroxyisobutyrate dehydrogenase-like beta-hydroxyacid dehydrogenase
VVLDWRRIFGRSNEIAPAIAEKFYKIKERDYSPEFQLRLMSKDMDLVVYTARKAGAALLAASIS